MKLLALDIDDTLVSTGKLPSERLKKAIRLAESHGVTVVLATGRGFLGSKQIRESLSVYGPLIHYGGAVVSDGRTGKHLFESEKERERLEKYIMSIRKRLNL